MHGVMACCYGSVVVKCVIFLMRILWVKGELSGDGFVVISRPFGGGCHEGRRP